MGREYVAHLRKMATDHLDDLGIPHHAVEADDTQTLDTQDHLERLQEAGFVYMQGGSSRFIVETLRGSRFLSEAARLRVPWVATSGATMAAGVRSVDPTVSPMWTGDGLALRALTFAAHWDTFDQRFPGFAQAYAEEAAGHPLVALDEETAIVHNGGDWTVFGERKVHVRGNGEWHTYEEGERLELPS